MILSRLFLHLKKKQKLNWKQLLCDYQSQHNYSLEPVKQRTSETQVPDDICCPECSAPSQYLYFNDGIKRSQIKCKVCNNLFNRHPKHNRKTKFWCPHCNSALFLWKQRKDCDIYKCPNDNCSLFVSNLNKLNKLEKLLRPTKSSQFKLRYQFREYNFTSDQLHHSEPDEADMIFNIRNSLNTLSLILTFYVSLAISARKTAFILKNVFGIPASYQTVLNYAHYAACHCHRFNLKFKGSVDPTQAGDETYIKISGKTAYTYFFICSKSRKISAYHIDHSRDTLPATIAMNEAIRTATPDSDITLVTDGNPSYAAGIHFLNLSKNNFIFHKKVIGLQNLDSESEEFRPFKQLVERLNRTYKFHLRASCGFNSKNGAVSLTTLFVTYYNFFRPHASLNYKPPVPLDDLKSIPTLQGKWAKILQNSFALA